MSASRRIGALVAPDLLLRAHLPPEALEAPAAVVEPRGVGGGRVLAVTAVGEAAGVRPGQTRVQAMARSERLQPFDLDPARLRAAQDRLLRAAATVSPVVEDGLALPPRGTDPLPGAGVVRFDTRGLGLLHPSAPELLGAAVRAAGAAGFPHARAALADGPFCAAVLAALGRGPVSPRGGDRTSLAPLPLQALVAPEAPPLPDDALERLRLMGVHTAGAFAALPASAVEARFGAGGLQLHRLAQGRDPRPLTPWAPQDALTLRRRPEAALTRLEAVEAELVPLLRQLLERLGRAGLALARLEVAFRLAGSRSLRRRIEVLDPHPTPASLMGLVRLDLEARPLGGPVRELALRAERTVPRDAGQADLFQSRAAGQGLERAVARLRGRLGPRRVGVPVLDDRQRPEAGFHLDEGLGPRRAAEPPPQAAPASVALRLYPSPRPIRVEADDDGRPVRVEARPAVAAGPFPMSGEWWAEGYDRVYFEVDAGEALLWLYRDVSDGRWYVHGVFD